MNLLNRVNMLFRRDHNKLYGDSLLSLISKFAAFLQYGILLPRLVAPLGLGWFAPYSIGLSVLGITTVSEVIIGPRFALILAESIRNGDKQDEAKVFENGMIISFAFGSIALAVGFAAFALPTWVPFPLAYRDLMQSHPSFWIATVLIVAVSIAVGIVSKIRMALGSLRRHYTLGIAGNAVSCVGLIILITQKGSPSLEGLLLVMYAPYCASNLTSLLFIVFERKYNIPPESGRATRFDQILCRRIFNEGLVCGYAAVSTTVNREIVRLSSFSRMSSADIGKLGMLYNVFGQLGGIIAVISQPGVAGLLSHETNNKTKRTIKRLMYGWAFLMSALVGFLLWVSAHFRFRTLDMFSECGSGDAWGMLGLYFLALSVGHINIQVINIAKGPYLTLAVTAVETSAILLLSPFSTAKYSHVVAILVVAGGTAAIAGAILSSRMSLSNEDEATPTVTT